MQTLIDGGAQRGVEGRGNQIINNGVASKNG